MGRPPSPLAVARAAAGQGKAYGLLPKGTALGAREETASDRPLSLAEQQDAEYAAALQHDLQPEADAEAAALLAQFDERGDLELPEEEGDNRDAVAKVVHDELAREEGEEPDVSPPERDASTRQTVVGAAKAAIRKFAAAGDKDFEPLVMPEPAQSPGGAGGATDPTNDPRGKNTTIIADNATARRGHVRWQRTPTKAAPKGAHLALPL